MRISLLQWCALAVALSVFGCATKKPVTVAVNPTPTAVAPKPAPKAQPTPVAEVRAVEFSPDRKWLAVGTLQPTDGMTGTITVRDCASNRIVKTWKVPGGVRYLAFSPDGKNIAATDTNARMTLWHWPDKKVIHTEKLDTGDEDTGRSSIDFSPDGRCIAVGVNRAQLFDTKTWKSRMLMPTAELGMIGQLRFSPMGRFLVTADDFEDAGGYVLFDLSRGKRHNAPGYECSGPPVFSRDGKLFVGQAWQSLTGGTSPYIDGLILFELPSLKVKRVIKTLHFTPAEFSPDDRSVVGLRGDDARGTVEIWNIRTGKRAQRFKQTARAVVWLDAKTLLAGDENGVQRLKVK